jgi:hypothetical protein
LNLFCISYPVSRLGGDLDPALHDWMHQQRVYRTRLVRGESAVAFETAHQDARTTAASPISVEHGDQYLKAVIETGFSHHALETQHLWMNRNMFESVVDNETNGCIN